EGAILIADHPLPIRILLAGRQAIYTAQRKMARPPGIRTMHDSSSPPRRPASVLAYAHPDLKRSVCVAGWILQAAGVLLMLLAAAGTVVAGIEEMSRQQPMPMGD